MINASNQARRESSNALVFCQLETSFCGPTLPCTAPAWFALTYNDTWVILKTWLVDHITEWPRLKMRMMLPVNQLRNATSGISSNLSGKTVLTGSVRRNNSDARKNNIWNEIRQKRTAELLTKEIMAAASKIFTNKSSNCSKISVSKDFPETKT